MAYNIVKHRRGTTKEWLEIDLIPEDGELVIEYCLDGTCKCKIGDGYRKFSKLPYLDKNIQDKLLDVKSTLEKLIEDSSAKQSTDLSTLRKSSTEALNNAELKWSSSLTKLQEELTSTEDSLTKTVNNLISDINNKHADLADDLSAELAEHVKHHNLDCANIISEITRLDETSKTTDAIINNTFIENLAKIYIEIADLVDDDILILKKVFAIESRVESFDDKLDNEVEFIEQTIRAVDDRLTTLLEQNILETVKTLSDRIVSTTNTLSENIENLRTNCNLQISANKKAIESLEAIIKDNEIATANRFIEVEARIESDKNSTIASIDDVNSRIDDVKSDVAQAEEDIKVQNQRISRIVALPEGTTMATAELEDIRTGYNGLEHRSAGDAVRAVGNDLQTLRNSLAQYIDSQAVDGLHYDYTGEVGLKQPYMLYLTAGNEVIQESGVQIISGAGGGGGSSTTSELKIGYITQSPMIVTPSDKAVLKFTFSGTDSSGDTIKQAQAAWKVNDITVEHSTVKNGENEFDLTKYIKTGTTKVLLIVTDDNGSVVTKTWSIQQVELTIDSAFNDKRKYPANEPIIFDYIPSGAIEKTAVFKLDGEVIDRVLLGKEVSGTTISYELPVLTHGSHLLDIYLEADINGDVIPSNHKLKDILCYDSSSNTPIIGTSTQNLSVKQYSTTNIIYTVYDPNNDTPTVNIEVDGIVVSSSTVKPNKDYDNTTTDIYAYTATTAGVHTIKIICGSTEKIINVFVENIGINISPVTTGLAFDFNPAGRSNGDSNRLWSHNSVSMTVSDDFDWVNGGYIPDDPDGPCFCIKAGSSAVIDYKLFANEAKITGKEFKLIFKTKNVSNPDAVFLSCLDNTTSKDYIGLKMGVHNAHIYGKNGNLELAYSEEDAIEFEFNISKDSEAVPMVMGYEDGVPSRPMIYDSTYSFKQNTPKVITLGSPDCDLYIYRFKVYNTSLSATDILNNFIADARTAEEMISRHTRNQIYDENHKLTAEVLAEKCPWLRVYKVSAPHFTNNKSDKVSGSTIQQIYRGGDPVLDNWIARNSQHSGQGTSSNNYGPSGRNLDFIMNKSNSYFELGDGTTADTITLTRTSVPVAYLNAKVNIASSNNLTNAILAKRYNQFNPYSRPFVREDESIIDYIKDTMEFYNCVIFIQETDPDLTTHREFADTDWHFYAIGNIGDSKKTDNTRLTDQNDPYECCVEIMDVGLPLSAFPRDTMINAMSYTVDEETGEANYTWAKDSNLGILYEKQDDGSYILTSDTTVDYNKTYYVDILEHDDFSEDFTYGWRYISDEDNDDVVNFCKQKWIDFYRFVTTSTDDEFKANLKDYFVVDSALYYYLFTTRYCMVDNRAKNTFWHYGKAADGTHKWDLCWDYDNDTSLGLNNYGKQVYRYGLEDIDYDTTGEEVFRQSDSLFFCRIRDLFSSELKQLYKTLESSDAWNANTFIKECDEWQSQFPEELWRLDIERKYIRTYNSSFINGQGDKQFLTNMANGRMKYHRRQWERNQEQYMASKYQTNTALSENYHANFRVSRFESTDDFVVQPNYQFTLTPYSYIYLNVQYGGTAPISVRAVPNVPTVVPYYGTSADIINVGSAAAIRDFGDLSALYADTISIQNAKRVKNLKIGNSTPGYDNNRFSSLSTGDNALLEELDITNITSYDTTLDLSKLLNLKKLYAYGTNIPGVIFAEGGKIDYVELPAINDIELKQLKYLSTTGFNLSSYDNVVTLLVEKCPLIDQLSLLESCTKVTKVKLDNVNFGTKTFEYFENNIFKLNGFDEDNPYAQLAGTVHFESLTGAQFNELKTRYPNLVITYDLLTSIITFKDTNLTSVIHEQSILNAGDCEDPIAVLGKQAPVKTATQEFTYEWFGWAEDKNVIVNYETLPDDKAEEAELADYNKYRVDIIKHVEGDRTLYPVFKAIRNSYEVRFVNPTDNNKVLQIIMVPYGDKPVYSGAEPIKKDAVSPELYEHIGWYPKINEITEPIILYADFAFLSDKWYTINIHDITDCTDYSGRVFDGYTLNDSNNTMYITECKNNLNPAVKVVGYFDKTTGEFSETQTSSTYTLTKLSGFAGHDKLELFDFPNTLLELGKSAFANCYNLFEITLPKNLQIIGDYAFQGCSKIKEIYIPSSVTKIGLGAFASCTGLTSYNVDENNTKFISKQGCLIDVSNKHLINGLATAEIPNDGSVISLGYHCFSDTAIVSVEIPEGVTSIADNAFSRCKQLTQVKLPSTLQILDDTCFTWCEKLKDIVLPEGLTQIKTYVFDGCILEDVVIPSSINKLLDRSFGDMPSLKTVTFKKALDADGKVNVPEINTNAFINSGSAENPIVFNVPWSEQQHKDNFEGTYTVGNIVYDKDPAFGAKYYVFNFDYEEEE